MSPIIIRRPPIRLKHGTGFQINLEIPVSLAYTTTVSVLSAHTPHTVIMGVLLRIYVYYPNYGINIPYVKL